MRAIDRLNRLKEEQESSLQMEKFVSLTNPKNIQLMQMLVAWTCVDTQFEGETEVSPNATMDELWKLTHPNMTALAHSAGVNLCDVFKYIEQLRNLVFIYPDGTALQKAIQVVRVYVQGKLFMLAPKDRRN